MFATESELRKIVMSEGEFIDSKLNTKSCRMRFVFHWLSSLHWFVLTANFTEFYRRRVRCPMTSSCTGYNHFILFQVWYLLETIFIVSYYLRILLLLVWKSQSKSSLYCQAYTMSTKILNTIVFSFVFNIFSIVY